MGFAKFATACAPIFAGDKGLRPALGGMGGTFDPLPNRKLAGGTTLALSGCSKFLPIAGEGARNGEA